MERYKDLINSACLGCGAWLCVMAGTYTGEIVCPKCFFANIFRDSSAPIPCHGAQASHVPQFVSGE
jgi:hypothetical protein